MALDKLRHIVLTDSPEINRYTTPVRPRGGGGTPAKKRAEHGQFLRDKFEHAWQSAEDEKVVSHSSRHGLYLEFKGDPGVALITKSLEDLNSKQIRLLNVRTVQEAYEDPDTHEETLLEVMYATVYVSHDRKQFFVKKIEEYLNNNTAKGVPRNQPLIDSIADVRNALLVDSFWTDPGVSKPSDDAEWVEVWLRGDVAEIPDDFESLIQKLGIEGRSGFLSFPERIVKVVYANNEQLQRITLDCEFVAEYRKAKAAAGFFMDLPNREKADWAQDLVERVQFNADSTASVCILDTGVNRGHPLLQPLLSPNDCQSVDPSWNSDDHDKHGTLMAGVVAFGDLSVPLQHSGGVAVTHRLESVKILPPPPLSNDSNLWGYVTAQAVSLAEIEAPERQRTFCMAVTAEDTRDRGRPTSWSAEIDKLASDAQCQRLFLLSAGNTTANLNDAATQYPDLQLTDSAHDPAQSWNALSVGALTSLDKIHDKSLSSYIPVAKSGQLSPFSTTSLTWERNKWPVKPELVLEGGNLAVDSSGFATDPDDLKILSTYYKPQDEYFYPFNMTSAAAAQLANMAGVLSSENPDFWPETIRALLVHSAEWPQNLKDQIISSDTKTDFKTLLSVCGYGVPDLERARYSTTNSLTMISQSTIQPFEKQKWGCRTRDMHLYELPWPKDVLLALPDKTPVQMRITLSYFVEPGPGEIGWKDRYRYPSHGLRFDLNSPGESKDEFSRRINMAARDEDNGLGHPGTDSASSHWLLGQARNRGSIHSDIWQGTAAELAASNLISVAPTTGWWKERNYLNRWDSESRYALVVSISTPDETVDVYTPVANQIGVPVAVTTTV